MYTSLSSLKEGSSRGREEGIKIWKIKYYFFPFAQPLQKRWNKFCSSMLCPQWLRRSTLMIIYCSNALREAILFFVYGTFQLFVSQRDIILPHTVFFEQTVSRRKSQKCQLLLCLLQTPLQQGHAWCASPKLTSTWAPRQHILEDLKQI